MIIHITESQTVVLSVQLHLLDVSRRQLPARRLGDRHHVARVLGGKSLHHGTAPVLSDHARQHQAEQQRVIQGDRSTRLGATSSTIIYNHHSGREHTGTYRY